MLRRWTLAVTLIVWGSFGTTQIAAAQDAPSGTEVRQFTAPIEVFECDPEFAPVAPTGMVDAPVGARFYVVDEGTAYVRILFVNWTSNARGYQERFNGFVENDEGDFVRNHSTPAPRFCVARSEYEVHAAPSYQVGLKHPTFSVGAMLVPVKLRIGGENREFDFESNVSLGVGLSIAFRIDRTRPRFVDLFAFGGISAVSLDQFNTDPPEAEQAEDAEDTEAEPTNFSFPQARPAFSVGGGIGFRAGGAQAAVLVGADLISNDSQVNWHYQGAPWLGVSIGTSLVSSTAAAVEDNGTGN